MNTPLQTSNKELFKRSAGYFKGQTRRIVIAGFSMLVVAMSTSATAYLVKPALDEIFISKDEEMLMLLPPIFVLLIMVKGFFRFMQNYQMRMAGLKVLEELRNELQSKMIRLPMSYFEEAKTGNLMSYVINDVTAIRNSLPSFVMLVRQVLTMLGLIGVVIWQDAYLAGWAILVMPIAVFPFYFFGRKLRKIGRRTQKTLADIAVILQEMLSGIRVVKAFAAEAVEEKSFRKENARLVDIAKKEVLYGEMSSPIMELVGALGIGLVVWYGGSRVIAGESTPGTFFSFMTAILLLYDPIKKLNNANQAIQRALAGAERVFAMLDAPDVSVEKGGSLPFPERFSSLKMDGLSFSYSTDGPPALDGINMDVRAGSTVALVGPSGAGKTTLVHMIPRFHDPTAGGVSVNDAPLQDYDLGQLRRGIGMVSQDAFLFNASVAENIAYAAEAPDMERIRQCAEAAYAHEFIAELPQGYDTVLGERGVKLSGGQKQRLTIARALYKDPALLILDEATSALDTQSEHMVQKALENLMQGRTSIVIAHRLSTILNADAIYVLENGRVAAQGNHAELLESSPLYAKLYAMQFQAG
jgi:subfamily B ATP-binding cassette protein MsbA